MSCMVCGGDEHEPITAGRFFPGSRIVRCRGCGLIHPEPLPAREAVEEFYRDRYYDYAALAGRLKRRLKLYYSGLRAASQFDWIAAALPGVSPGRVLEVGCGYGSLLERFARAGWEARGVEPSSDAAAWAARRLAGQGGRVFHGPFEQFDPGGERFRLIVLSHVFEHFLHPEQVLARLETLLTPGGRIFFELPNADNHHYRETGYALIPDFYFFSDTSFSAFVRARGFELERLGHFDYARLVNRHDSLGLGVNYLWWALRDGFGRPCLLPAGREGIWMRALIGKLAD